MKVIKDDYGKEYKVSDFEAFKRHIKLYHSKNGKGDRSIHEEVELLILLLDEMWQHPFPYRKTGFEHNLFFSKNFGGYL